MTKNLIISLAAGSACLGLIQHLTSGKFISIKHFTFFKYSTPLLGLNCNCSSLQKEGGHPSPQHQKGTYPQLLSLRLAVACCAERPRSCRSSQGSLHSHRCHYHCNLYAIMGCLSFPQHAVPPLPLEWSASWK